MPKIWQFLTFPKLTYISPRETRIPLRNQRAMKRKARSTGSEESRDPDEQFRIGVAEYVEEIYDEKWGCTIENFLKMLDSLPMRDLRKLFNVFRPVEEDAESYFEAAKTCDVCGIPTFTPTAQSCVKWKHDNRPGNEDKYMCSRHFQQLRGHLREGGNNFFVFF